VSCKQQVVGSNPTAGSIGRGIEVRARLPTGLVVVGSEVDETTWWDGADAWTKPVGSRRHLGVVLDPVGSTHDPEGVFDDRRSHADERR
jgi:hypothetical protein